jgi:hypothetical protein
MSSVRKYSPINRISNANNPLFLKLHGNAVKCFVELHFKDVGIRTAETSNFVFSV